MKFTVPAVQCNGQNAVFGSFLTGFASGAGVLVICGDGTGPPVYFGYIDGSEVFVPRPGDLVKTRVLQSRTADVATLTDVTQALSDSMSLDSSPGPTVAYDGISTGFCIFHACYASLPSNFGKIRMFDATLNGVTPRTAGATAVNMQNPPFGIATTALNTTGNDWSEVWRNL